MASSAVRSVSRLPAAGPFPTPDPFLFCVYHNDAFPKGNDKMEAPRVGDGADFNPATPYRMYHGNTIPGFPQHPHRGFETLTATMEGVVDHSDSMGNAGRYGHGDLQWMTAGKGIVHGEMFPLVHEDQPNPLKLFQIWLNLPAKSKMCDPAFVMQWSENIPIVTSRDGKTKVTLWAGELEGKKGLAGPPESYASQDGADVAVMLFQMAPGGSFTVPAAVSGSSANRNVYFHEGDGLLLIGDREVDERCMADLDAGVDAVLSNPSPSGTTNVLLLQGNPIGEPVAQHGPFVMNTQKEIQEAFADYRATQFGGWPWPHDAMVFPRDKGRFALLNGVEDVPSGDECLVD